MCDNINVNVKSLQENFYLLYHQLKLTTHNSKLLFLLPTPNSLLSTPYFLLFSALYSAPFPVSTVLMVRKKIMLSRAQFLFLI